MTDAPHSSAKCILESNRSLSFDSNDAAGGVFMYNAENIAPNAFAMDDAVCIIFVFEGDEDIQTKICSAFLSVFLLRLSDKFYRPPFFI